MQAATWLVARGNKSSSARRRKKAMQWHRWPPTTRSDGNSGKEVSLNRMQTGHYFCLSCTDTDRYFNYIISSPLFSKNLFLNISKYPGCHEPPPSFNSKKGSVIRRKPSFMRIVSRFKFVTVKRYFIYSCSTFRLSSSRISKKEKLSIALLIKIS